MERIHWRAHGRGGVRVRISQDPRRSRFLKQILQILKGWRGFIKIYFFIFQYQDK